MSESDPEFVKRREEFQPEFAKDEPRFHGAEPEQAQVQRTTQGQKKHDALEKKEYREAGRKTRSSSNNEPKR